jgi:lipoprotein-anchoring transpeptidase ErfK/SrfK
MRSTGCRHPRAGGIATCSSIVVATLATLAVPAAGARAATDAGPARTRELAALLATHVVSSRPDAHSAQLGLVEARRPITGTQTILPVLGHRTDARGRRWLRVMLPGRPNGRTGWIARRATVSYVTPWYLVVDVSRRKVTVYLRGRPIRTFRAIVGKPSTPTPEGRFFVEESIKLRAGDVGAPFALALSARSSVLQEFAGGPGQIALHGLSNVGGALGTAVSHGCVRLDDDAIRWLAARIGAGVPVTIVG